MVIGKCIIVKIHQFSFPVPKILFVISNCLTREALHQRLAQDQLQVMIFSLDPLEILLLQYVLSHSGGLKAPKTLSSQREANIMKMKYQIKRIIPSFLSSLQLFMWQTTIRKTIVENRLKVEYTKPENILFEKG